MMAVVTIVLRRRLILQRETNVQKNDTYALQKKYIKLLSKKYTHNINVRN